MGLHPQRSHFQIRAYSQVSEVTALTFFFYGTRLGDGPEGRAYGEANHLRKSEVIPGRACPRGGGKSEKEEVVHSQGSQNA